MTRITRKVAAAPAAALAAAALVLGGGGIALAASQGAVHVPFTGHDNRSDEAPAAAASVNPGITGTGVPSDDATADVDATPDASPSATPSPSLDGLCVAFQAGAVDKAASNPAFTALQDAAGGADNVAAYCVTRIGEPTHPAAPTHPAKPSQAETHPAPHATPSHPAGRDGAPDVAGTHSRASR
jgi:hypothetical protein